MERAGREALNDLRWLVGTLRRGHDGDPDTPSTNGLHQFSSLADGARATGVAVDLQLDQPLPIIDPRVEFVAYRLVQEAITNSIKHAGPTRVLVSVQFSQTDLTMTVSDTGPGPNGSTPPPGSGQGLIGMRERVATLSGDVRAGPREGGRVRSPSPIAPPPSGARD